MTRLDSLEILTCGPEISVREASGRSDAGTFNPALIRTVEKLGWRIEDVKPAHVRIGE